MPVDACRFFHQCGGCSVLMRPLQGDCCVFCSFGSRACPSMQCDGEKFCGSRLSP